MLVHLPRKDGWGEKERVKNGPALGGYGAESMREALTDGFAELPDQLRRSLTWDRGKELAQHAQLKIDTGLDVFFADPHSPWQRGMNENTNGPLRQYFPKGTDLSRWSAEEIEAVAATLNSRPRKGSRLEDPHRSPRRTPTLSSTGRCCFDRLSPPGCCQWKWRTSPARTLLASPPDQPRHDIGHPLFGDGALSYTRPGFAGS